MPSTPQELKDAEIIELLRVAMIEMQSIYRGGYTDSLGWGNPGSVEIEVKLLNPHPALVKRLRELMASKQ